MQTLPTTMQAVILQNHGGPETLAYQTTTTPVAEAGEVLIKVSATGVNFSDLLRRKNRYFMPTPLPYCLGVEAVGTVVAVGEGISETEGPFALGSRVLAILPHGGGYAEYAKAPAQFCVPLPPHISDEVATAIFVQGSTAYLLANAMTEASGKSVLVHAGASGLGQILIQLLRLAGASRIIGTASTEAKCSAILKAGADAAVNYSQSDWTAKVLEANHDQKLDIVYEMVGGDVFNQSLYLIADGGQLIVYGAASGQQGKILSERFVDTNLSITGFNLAYQIMFHPARWQQALGAVIGMLAEGALSVYNINTYPLADASTAHQDLEERKLIGKVVLIP